MTIAKSLLLFIPAMLIATPALAQNADPPEEDEVIVIDPWTTVPHVPDIQFALDQLNKCRGRAEPPCLPPERTYVVHSATCVSIAPPSGPPAAACRVDMTMTDTVPALKVTRFRDQCARFAYESPPGSSGWRVARNWELPCEVPSMLKRDPHPRPGRKDLEEAAVGAFQCYDGETSDCFNYSESATVKSWRCRPQPPREEGKPRFVCRINGVVRFTSIPPRPFRNLCVRIARYTDPGESPPFWGIDYKEGDPDCEADWAKRR
ncbi:MAG: hypothetical protein ACAH11_10385 [Sphingomonas sp.]